MLRYLFLLLVACPLFAIAQKRWDALPLKFDSQILTLYADTTTGGLYIAGYSGNVNGKDSSIVIWDGSHATFMQPPFDDADFLIKHNGKLVVAGISYGPPATYKLSSFDGLSWTILDSSPSTTGTSGAPVGIVDSSVVFTGIFNSIAGHPIKNAALWNGGTVWRDLFRIDSCMPSDPTINTVLRYKGEVYACGNFYSPRSMTHIARFDGSNWNDVGGGIHGNGLSIVNCMLVWKNELYVAGEFLEKDGSPGNCIAKWDGQMWKRLGSGITQGGNEAAIYDMAVYHDNLYVVGVFSNAGGVYANNIAKWDGRRWCSLNANFAQGTPSQIEVAKGELYISGQLTTINGDTVSHMAHWIGGDYVYQCGPAEPTEAAQISSQDQTELLYPNPANVMLYTKRQDIQSLSICDITGKIIKTATLAELNQGMNVSDWPVGFYYATASLTDGAILSSKFVKQ